MVSLIDARAAPRAPGRGPEPGRPGRPVGHRRRWWLAAAVLVGGWAMVGVVVGPGGQLNAGGWPIARQFLAAALAPSLDAQFLTVIADATLTTVAFAVLGTVIAIVVAFPSCFVLSQLRWATGRSVRAPWLLARAWCAVPRGLHESVWAVVLILILGLDPLVAILAIGIPFGAVTARVYADLVDNAPRAAFDAIRIAGGTPKRAFYYGLVPHVAPDMISYALYRFECSIRSATAIGMIGAGGLGFQLILSYQSLNFDELWTTIYVLGILCALADILSNRIRKWQRDTSVRRRIPVSVIAGLVVTVIGAAWTVSRADVTTLWSQRARAQLADLVDRVWPLDLGRDALADLVHAAVETLQMSIMAVLVSTAAGIVVAIVAARSGGPSRGGGVALGLVMQALLLGCRAIPPPVWAVLFLFVMTPGPLVGALALGAYNLGVLGRLITEVVENCDPRPAGVVEVTGAGALRGWWYAVWPQIAPNAIALGLYRWEVLIRETVIVGLVGAGGLGRVLTEQMVAFDWPGIAMTIAALVGLTMMVDAITAGATKVVR